MSKRQTLGTFLALTLLAIAIIGGSEYMRRDQAVLERGDELP